VAFASWPWPNATLIAAIEQRAAAIRAYSDLLTEANNLEEEKIKNQNKATDGEQRLWFNNSIRWVHLLWLASNCKRYEATD